MAHHYIPYIRSLNKDKNSMLKSLYIGIEDMKYEDKVFFMHLNKLLRRYKLSPTQLLRLHEKYSVSHHFYEQFNRLIKIYNTQGLNGLIYDIESCNDGNCYILKLQKNGYEKKYNITIGSLNSSCSNIVSIITYSMKNEMKFVLFMLIFGGVIATINDFIGQYAYDTVDVKPVILTMLQTLIRIDMDLKGDAIYLNKYLWLKRIHLCKGLPLFKHMLFLSEPKLNF